MNKNSLSSLNSFNFVNSNDEDMVHYINELVDLIKEHYKIIKNEIKEGKTLSSNEKLDLNIILNIESQLNSFFSKAKEIINKLKLTRKRKKQCEKESKTFNLISPKSNMNLYKNMKFKNMNLSYVNEKELKSCNSQKNMNKLNNNNFISIEKYKNNIISKNKHKKYYSKESKNSTNDDTSFDFKQNLYIKRIKKNESENNNNFIHSNPKRNIKVNKSKLSDYKEKTNYCLDNKYINEYKLQNDTIIKNNLTISKMKSEIENLQKQLKKEKNRNINIKTKNKEPLNKKKNKLEDNIMKNLEIKITKLTSDLKNSNDLYSEKLSNVKKEMENHIENIINLKNEIEEYDKYCENEYLKNNSLPNQANSENYYLDLIEKDKLKISELSKINDELSNKNNELSLNNLELNNSKSKLLNENSQLITVKKELENKINNLKKQLEIMKENKENNINYSFSNMTNNSNLVVFSKDNESDNENENEKEKVNESIFVNKKNKNEKSEEQITQEIKELQNEIKIKDLTINTLTEEINLKDNQISQLIVEKANLSNYQNNLNKSKLNRSQSEKIYSKLQKENNELIKQLSKITNNLGKIMDENEYNKIRISKLNKKLNDKDNFQSKEIIEKYEQKLKEINNKYKKNEIYLQEQINELKLSNIEKDENNKALQNEYLKLKWDIEEKK